MKLENLPKKNIYEVPDGYFDKLPGIIQARISEQEVQKRPFFLMALRYSLPAVVLVILAVFWFSRLDKSTAGPEEILASVNTESLLAYLEDSEISTDELLDSFGLTLDDVDEIENSVYDLGFEEDELEMWLDEYNYDNENL